MKWNIQLISLQLWQALRYYDEVGILKPARINSSGYRIYGKNEVDRLQQILFYRELDVGLNEIKEMKQMLLKIIMKGFLKEDSD